MSNEKSLGQIALDAYTAHNSTSPEFERFEYMAKVIEKEVLARLKKDDEPVAGQVLTFLQALQWVEKHGSTEGLQVLLSLNKWVDTYNTNIYSQYFYRVAPKKINDPDDPTTWEKGIGVFVRDSPKAHWELWTFESFYSDDLLPFKVCSAVNFWVGSIFKYAKIATPEQIEAWNSIYND